MSRTYFIYLLAILGFLHHGLAAEGAKDRRFIDPRSGEGFANKVVVLKVGRDDLMNKGSFEFFRRQMLRANEEKARAIVFELNTPGGFAFDTIKLIVEDMQKLEVETFAFVNQEATSAGAITAFGCDKIYMHPVSTIGSAAVVTGGGGEVEGTMKAKIESFMDATVSAVATDKGHNPDVARAMMFVDEEYEFGDIKKVEKGKLLNLTAKEATSEWRGQPLLAAGLVKSVEELLQAEGIDAEVVVAEPSGFEKLAMWVAKWSALLILGGLLFAYVESQAPGFGVGGFLSICCFGLFFFGNNMAGNLAGYEHIALFLIGVVLIVFEVFIMPGFIIPGLLGVFMVLGSLVSAMGSQSGWERIAEGEFSLGAMIDWVRGPLLTLSIGIVLAVVAILLVMKFLPNIPILRGLRLEKALPSGLNPDDQDAANDGERREERPNAGLVGQVGVVTTALRPVGKVKIEGQIHDATLGTGYLEKDKQVRVIEHVGHRIKVEPIA